MAAAALISQFSQALSFLREHPKLSCVLLLLLSPPIYRILLYFTPLLLSTALCIFALITLTPYVTATDAEVERQSMLGASSSQRQVKKKTITSTASASKDRKVEDVSGYGKPSSASSSAAPSATTACPSSSDSETSWFSWMKGLNDIGRTWMENKLIEQGLALSEPANRETLLAFIEGSFADLISAQANPSADLFDAMDNREDVVVGAESVSAADNNDEAIKASTIDCGRSEGHALQKNREDENVGTKVRSIGDMVMTKNASNEENIAAEIESATITNNVCAVSKEQLHVACEAKALQGSPTPLVDDVKERKQKLHIGHENSSLPVLDDIPDMSAATMMPRTPSRIPAPSKLLEASRRIFSKEEQNRTMLPRAPLQASTASRVNQPFKSSLGSTHSKMESSVSVFKRPAMKFLERSRSIPSKEGSKLSNTTLGAQAGSKFVQGEMKNCDALYASEVNEGFCGVSAEVGDAVNAIRNVNDINDASNLTSDAGDEGPRFDEDLKVEEAQALVQSELKMLEVELDEVAAKLPKLDETFAYQKTPIKSLATSLTPIGASIKCPSNLF